MNQYEIIFHPDAKNEFDELDGSIEIPVLKQTAKLQERTTFDEFYLIVWQQMPDCILFMGKSNFAQLGLTGKRGHTGQKGRRYRWDKTSFKVIVVFYLIVFRTTGTRPRLLIAC